VLVLLILHLFTILLLDFGIFPAVWYYCFHFISP